MRRSGNLLSDTLTILISHEDLAVQHFIVSEDVVQHLFIEIFGGVLKSYFHTTCLLSFEIDVPKQFLEQVYIQNMIFRAGHTEVPGSI